MMTPGEAHATLDRLVTLARPYSESVQDMADNDPDGAVYFAVVTLIDNHVRVPADLAAKLAEWPMDDDEETVDLHGIVTELITH